jgi:uncharacterized DUF497 family protein
MQFEWDPEKARRNMAKHGVEFDVALRVFDDPLAITELDRVVDGEERFRTIGRVGEVTILFVAHTWVEADEVHVRIISARKADRTERRAYETGDEGHFR